MTDTMERPIRIGAVNYLNSKPLIEGLQEQAAGANLVLDYPSRLADGLAKGDLDVALVPSIECFCDPGYEVISDACVAACGPVLSVKLYSRCDFSKIGTLALDEGSRTSAALVQIMLGQRFGIRPAIEPLPMGCWTDATTADAILLIGDRAMHQPEEQFAATWDLGEEWLNWTGLPFVFAMWAAREETELGNVEEILNQTRDRGVENLAAIARREAPLLKISEQTAIDYMTENLHYRLGSAEREGLLLFHKLAVKAGLAPEGVELVFRNCISAG